MFLGDCGVLWGGDCSRLVQGDPLAISPIFYVMPHPAIGAPDAGRVDGHTMVTSAGRGAGKNDL